MVHQFLRYFFILGVCMGAYLVAEEPCYTVIPDQAYLPILTPSLAQRQTLKLRLPNGLEAYLIADPEATQAGAVLTVQAGSWNDPDKYPGLAHFLEHMLFLGTEKYPIESDYDRFIRAHDGKTNAYTASDYTLYLFSISPPAFEEALDRFSFFFKKPLFNPSGVDRELHSIDQEFAKNFNQDHTRESYVRKHLANALHPFHRFNTGNSATLSRVTQKVLRQWYQDHYSAHLMRLIVYGPYSLEALKNWVLQDFKEIPSTGQQPSSFPSPTLSEETQGKIVYIEPVKNLRALRLVWELPLSLSLPNSFRTTDLICSILGHEGAGSLLSILKEEGLADDLSCSGYRLTKSQLFFSLYINLTQEGLERVQQVIERCFQAIQALQQHEKDFPSYLFDESKKIHTFRYQYQSREDTFNYLMDLGGLCVYEDLSTFPEAAVIPQTFDQQLARELLSHLTPQRAHFTVLARHPEIVCDQTEPWMEIPYKIVPLSAQQLKDWSHLPLHPSFHLPEPNPFIPQDFKLVNPLSSSQTPQNPLPKPLLIVDDAEAKIYFATDHRFHIPVTMWFFEIKTPSIESNDPTKVVLGDLYVKCLEEALQSYSYPAQLADLSYQISRTSNGILLSLSGYRDNAETLFEMILAKLKNCRPSESLFQISRDSLLRQYHDFKQETPLQQGMEAFRQILYESYSTYQQRAEALEQVSYENLLHYMDHLYDQTYTEGLLYGNVSQNQASQVWKKLHATLASQIFPSNQRLVERILVLPHQTGPYILDLHVQSSAHAAILGVEGQAFSFKTRAAQQILGQAMNSAFYSTLRTKQQTCYLLYSRAEELDKHLFSFFAVQSTTHDPRDLLARFELFIESFLEEMEHQELTEQHFENIRHSLLNTLENTPQNLVETGHLLKTLAFKYEGDFEWLTKRIQGLRELTYQEFLEISKQFLGKQNKQRLAILIRGTAEKDFHYHSLSTPQEMRKLSQYTHLSE